MKKILLTTAIVLSGAMMIGCSGSDSNTKAESSSAKTSNSMNNTTIAQKYNRNNSTSTADIKKLGGNSSSYAGALANAKAEQKKAQKAGFEWNTIRKLMKAAKKDQKAGNESAAVKKLNTAALHAKLGQQQAIDQKNAGPRF
jgi:uncharacterized protein YabN with tetrapyrrole methylase and pyrophosphatase domain